MVIIRRQQIDVAVVSDDPEAGACLIFPANAKGRHSLVGAGAGEAQQGEIIDTQLAQVANSFFEVVDILRWQMMNSDIFGAILLQYFGGDRIQVTDKRVDFQVQLPGESGTTVSRHDQPRCPQRSRVEIGGNRAVTENQGVIL